MSFLVAMFIWQHSNRISIYPKGFGNLFLYLQRPLDTQNPFRYTFPAFVFSYSYLLSVNQDYPEKGRGPLGTLRPLSVSMKKDIHPAYFENAAIACACGNSFTVGSTMKEIRVELCNNCHPFYTGKQKFVDTARRVEKFQEKMEKAKTTATTRRTKKVKRAERAKKKTPTVVDLTAQEPAPKKTKKAAKTK